MWREAAAVVTIFLAPAPVSTCTPTPSQSDLYKAFYSTVHKYGITSATGRHIKDAYCDGDQAEVRRLFVMAADREYQESQHALDQITRAAGKAWCPGIIYYQVPIRERQ